MIFSNSILYAIIVVLKIMRDEICVMKYEFQKFQIIFLW